MSYIELAKAKQYLNVTVNDDDVLLTECIARAQSAVDAFCNRTFEAAADSARLFEADQSSNGPLLYLDADLCALTGIAIDGEAADISDLRTVPLNGRPWWALRRPGGWRGDIEVTGRWAYSVTAPEAVQQACLRLAVWLYRQKDSNADPGAPQLTAEGTWLMPSQMPKDIMALLAPFRRIAT